MPEGGLNAQVCLAYQTQTKWLPRVPERTINKIIGGLVTGKVLDKNLSFDLLAPEQYQNYGLRGNQVKNPVLQSRVIVNRYQQLLQHTGNKDLALWLLCGGTVKMYDYYKGTAAGVKHAYSGIDSNNILKTPTRSNANIQYYKEIL